MVLGLYESLTFFFLNSQGHKPIGKLRIDLGGVAKHDGTSTTEFQFEKKKSSLQVR